MASISVAGGRTRGTGCGQASGVRLQDSVPPAVPRRSPPPSAQRTRHPTVALWADSLGSVPPRASGPSPWGRARRWTPPGPHMGGGDERPLNPGTPLRCDHPRPTRGATYANRRRDAGPGDAFGEPRIPCPLGARHTPSPRAPRAERRSRGFGRVTPSRWLPPAAAPASGRATVPRADAPGGC